MRFSQWDECMESAVFLFFIELQANLGLSPRFFRESLRILRKIPFGFVSSVLKIHAAHVC